MALDRAAVVAAKMAPASAPAATAAMAPAPRGTSEVMNRFYASNPGASATSFQVPPGSVQDANVLLGISIVASPAYKERTLLCPEHLRRVFLLAHVLKVYTASTTGHP